MQATEILSSEHRVIESVIAALDAAAQRLDAGEAVRPGFFLDATRFIRNFATATTTGRRKACCLRRWPATACRSTTAPSA